jgi:hypothetical protein
MPVLWRTLRRYSIEVTHRIVLAGQYGQEVLASAIVRGDSKGQLVYYCEIIVRETGEAKFYRGQGSSYRVAAMRAAAQLACAGSSSSDFGMAGKWENVTIKTGKVG